MQFNKLAKFIEKVAMERGFVDGKVDTKKSRQEAPVTIKQEQLESYFRDQEKEESESPKKFNREIL